SPWARLIATTSEPGSGADRGSPGGRMIEPRLTITTRGRSLIATGPGAAEAGGPGERAAVVAERSPHGSAPCHPGARYDSDARCRIPDSGGRARVNRSVARPGSEPSARDRWPADRPDQYRHALNRGTR